ncbi:MAG: class I SAM-dependent methyltransferase [Thaumarchaeota archaeon]|nr:class I SAM-dependent methyltransferase [Nitrososphaerota archaeon]MCL5318564.1 class I SAM-dependent methyltransferase [Nitrososphaerota archaeon]
MNSESFTDVFPSYKPRALKGKLRYDVMPFVGATVQTLKPRQLLDVGSATGLYVLAIRRRRVASFGIDASEEALSRAPDSVKNYLYKVDLDNDRFPFPDDSFDVVLCLRVAEFLNNPEHAFGEISRVVRNQALFIMINPRSFNRQIMKCALPKRSWLAILQASGLQETRYCKYLEIKFKLRYLRNFIRTMSIDSDGIQALISTISLICGYHYLFIVSKKGRPSPQ